MAELIAVLLIVACCGVYSVWRLLPRGVQQRVRQRLRAKGPGGQLANLSASASQTGLACGGGCVGCGTPAEQPVHWVGRGRPGS